MIALTKLERSQIQGVTQSPQWAVFQRFAELLIQKFQGENCVSETEWETTKKTLLKEGKAQGVQELFQELMNASNE